MLATHAVGRTMVVIVAFVGVDNEKFVTYPLDSILGVVEEGGEDSLNFGRTVSRLNPSRMHRS